MLSREVMGLLALAILWVNTLLIAAAAALDLKDLLARRRSLRRADARSVGADRGGGIIEGRVARGDGPEGALASQRVEQIGRSAASAKANPGILFGDRSFEGEIFGGAIAVEVEPGTTEEIEIAPARSAEVWVSEGALRTSGACPSRARFDEAYEDAKKARGFTRTIVAPILAGERVWISASLARRRGHEPSAQATDATDADRSPRPLVSTLDARAVCARKIALSVASIAAILALCAALSAVALYPPRFGFVSTIGGALCFLFFLLVQPAGTALRDAVRLPHQAFLRGRWRRES